MTSANAETLNTNLNSTENMNANSVSRGERVQVYFFNMQELKCVEKTITEIKEEIKDEPKEENKEKIHFIYPRFKLE